MPSLAAVWIIATHFLGAYLSSICVSYNVYKIALIVTNTSITPVLKELHWLPDEHRSAFKTATLVYKFLHSGLPQYFDPYLQ